MEINNFEFNNKTNMNDLAPEYLYYDIVNRFPYIDFTQYKEVLPNGVEVISVNNYHRCLLDNDENYKKYVIEEVLYDIDKFGYYGDEDFEDAIETASMLLESELTPDDVGEDVWNAIGHMSMKQYEKWTTKLKRNGGCGRYAKVKFKK